MTGAAFDPRRGPLRGLSGRGAGAGTAAVREAFDRATCSGVPQATTRPPFSPALRAEVDDAVGGGDQVEVVLDDDHGVAAVHEALEGGDEPRHVGHVEAGRRLVEDVERRAEAGRGELRGELDALGLAAGERGRGLAEARGSRGRSRRGSRAAGGWRPTAERCSRASSIVISRTSATERPLEEDGLGVGVVAAALAGLAGDVGVGQEGHRDAQPALALAALAAAALHVEGEAAAAVAEGARVGHRGEERADRVHDADVGGGHGARGAADRRLVHLEGARRRRAGP